MRPIAALFVASIALAGCATASQSSLDARLSPLVGVSEADLTRRIGQPTRVADTAGQRALIYFEAWPLLGGANNATPHEQPRDRFCEVTFTVQQGKVSSYGLRGITCGWNGRLGNLAI